MRFTLVDTILFYFKRFLCHTILEIDFVTKIENHFYTNFRGNRLSASSRQCDSDVCQKCIQHFSCKKKIKVFTFIQLKIKKLVILFTLQIIDGNWTSRNKNEVVETIDSSFAISKQILLSFTSVYTGHVCVSLCCTIV